MPNFADAQTHTVTLNSIQLKWIYSFCDLVLRMGDLKKKTTQSLNNESSTQQHQIFHPFCVFTLTLRAIIVLTERQKCRVGSRKMANRSINGELQKDAMLYVSLIFVSLEEDVYSHITLSYENLIAWSSHICSFPTTNLACTILMEILNPFTSWSVIGSVFISYYIYSMWILHGICRDIAEKYLRN